MLEFVTCMATAAMAPISLAAGLFIGYLFHKEWNQLAWPLLLFIVPGIGSLDSTAHAHGAVYMAAAEFLAICVLTGGSFWIFEHFANRRQAPKPRA
jgi:hypothetical protein